MILKFKIYLLTCHHCHCHHCHDHCRCCQRCHCCGGFQGMAVPSFQVWNGRIISLLGSTVTVMIGIISMSRTMSGSKVSPRNLVRVIFLLSICMGIKWWISPNRCCSWAKAPCCWWMIERSFLVECQKVLAMVSFFIAGFLIIWTKNEKSMMYFGIFMFWYALNRN